MPEQPANSIEGLNTPNAANRMPAIYVLLVIEDDLIANRMAGLVGTSYSIIRFRVIKDAEQWLTDGQKVDLIIADRNSGDTMARVVRGRSDYQSVPFLITSRFGETLLGKTTRITGITDVLVINEDNQRLQAKISYYLRLNTQVQTFKAPQYSAAAQPFYLPRWKRLLDISVALTLLLLLSPILVVVALLIVLDSKGPVIYKSKRAGANFHVFDMYKFRTMKVAADQLLTQLAAHNIYATPSAETNTTEKTVCSACRQQGVPCQQLLFDQDRPICEKLYLQESEGVG